MDVSDDDGELLQTAFHVEAGEDEFDLDIPPTSGMEYLRRVQVEAKQCPQVVVANIDTKVFQDKQTVKVSASNGIHTAPFGLAPSAEWQTLQNSNFAQLRQKMSRYKAQLQKKKMKPSKKLPLYDDVEGWCRLCFGRLRPLRQVADSDSSTDHSHDDESVPPLLSIVAHLDQPTVVQVLEYHINWFEATGFSPIQGQWFYALLTCLEKPLVPEACSSLRSLARNCATLRATMDRENDPYLVPMNLFISLVSHYFEQTDLADPT